MLDEAIPSEIEQLWAQTLGEPEIRVAILDGPVDVHHPSLSQANLLTVPTLICNQVAQSAASRHGTQIASILFGQHSAGPIQGIAPRCTGLLMPIFADQLDGSAVFCSQLDLARAIIQATDSHANIINVSGGQFSPSGTAHPILRDAVDYAVSRGVLVVAAAGNDGCECLHIPSALPGVLAVGAMTRNAKPLELSNWGASYAKNGILAPGENIKVALPGGAVGVMTGTSSASAVVAGVAALLLSIQHKRGLTVNASQVRAALIESAMPCERASPEDCQRMLAGRLNISGALSFLIHGGNSMSLNDQHANEFEEMPASSCDPESPLIEVSDCGCGSKQSKLPGTVSSAISPAPVQLVYALGTLGFDFGSEARRDSIVQHMNAQDGGQSPYDANHLLKYLDKNPWDAQSIYWVLTLDTTPIYVIQPRGAFAAAGYERLRQFLREQVADAIERVSIPGVIIGRAKLMSGQVLPVVWPDLRGMSNWNTSALVSATVSNDQTGSGSERQDDIASFLERIYHGLRNLGLSSQDRAINFAATNALNAARVFETALKDRMHLDTIEVERSPICRPESDCWDVKLTFFDPEHQTQRARHVYRFTVDVSDICPVMVGGVRSWSIR